MLWLLKRALRKGYRIVRGSPLVAPVSRPDPTTPERKAAKLARVRSLLDASLPHDETPTFFDFLTADLRREFDIVDTSNVSANEYDPNALALIEKYQSGLILDCGAGFRPTYYDNVVNFDICPYPSTDVRGVGERLPFRDGVFDAVFSFAVLEHVQDPFACAREISRVLKPGGELYCVVPFLQPYHGYPHHYYNMTHQGLSNLFRKELTIEKQEVIGSGLPLWTLMHIIDVWARGLPPITRLRFLNMKLKDLLGDPMELMKEPFVQHLPPEQNFEIASTTALRARKPAA